MGKKSENKLLSVYLTVGSDTLKRTEAHKRMRSRFEADPNFEFNYSKFDGEKTCAEDIIAAANLLPFASDLRLVEVTNIDKLHTREKDRKLLAEYVKNPSPSTILLLDAETLAKNTLLYKAVASVGAHAVIDCSQKKNYELVSLIKNIAKGANVNFTEAAARELIELVGSDTTTLNSYIQRVINEHSGSQNIGVGQVRDVVSRTQEIKPWDFINAFGERNLGKCLSYMQTDKLPSPYAMLPMCTNTLREIVCAKSLAGGVRGGARGGSLSGARSGGQSGGRGLAAGARSQNLVAEISNFRGKRVQDFQVKNYPSWAKCWSEAKLCSAIKSASDAELNMKSGTNAKDAFQDWVIAALA